MGSWRNHIEGMAKSASKKLGVLFRCRSFFSSSELLQLYVGLIRPCMEYCSHVWGGSPCTRLLDKVEAKAFRLIDDARLTSPLDSLSLRRRVASLSIFYRIYFGHCSHELRSIIPPPLLRPAVLGRQSPHTVSVWGCLMIVFLGIVNHSFQLLHESGTPYPSPFFQTHIT